MMIASGSNFFSGDCHIAGSFFRGRCFCRRFAMTSAKLAIRNDVADRVRHCEAHIEILKIEKNNPCRGNLTNWNHMPTSCVIARNFGSRCLSGLPKIPRQSSERNVIAGFNQEVVALTTDSGSNFFSGDCHIAGSSFIA
jgi:hypothetical protein